MLRGKHSKPKLNFEQPLEVGRSQQKEDNIHRRDWAFFQRIPGPEYDFDGVRYYNSFKLGSWKDLQARVSNNISQIQSSLLGHQNDNQGLAP